MNTDTGRVYDLDELYGGMSREERRRRERERRTELRALFHANSSAKVEYSAVGEPLDIEAQRREFEIASALRKAVPVSPVVAQQVVLGQRELERRKRRRKAEREARRRNR